MEQSKHLSYFKVENFKCFESFEMDNIGQFNLIVGDNNVGKSNLLEALCFRGELNDYVGRLFACYVHRNFFWRLKDDEKNFDFEKYAFTADLSKNKIKYSLGFRDNEIQLYNIENWKLNTLPQHLLLLNQSNVGLLLAQQTNQSDKNLISLSVNSGLPEQNSIHVQANTYNKVKIPMVFTGISFGNDLHTYYSSITDNNKSEKAKIISDMQGFISELEDMDVSSNIVPNQTTIALSLKNFKNKLPLSSQGSGSIRLLRIILSIIEEQNKFLLIDEIDGGIHFSRFKDYWKTILSSSQKNNVQLFMTTHSQECIQYFKEALEELGDEFQEKARLISLAKTKDGNVKSFNFNYSAFNRNIELENEMRD